MGTSSKSMTLNAVEGPQLPSQPAPESLGEFPWEPTGALLVPKVEALKSALPQLDPQESHMPEEPPSPSAMPVPEIQRWSEVPVPGGRSLHPPPEQEKRPPLHDELPLPAPQDDDQ